MDIIKAVMHKGQIITENSGDARALHQVVRYGIMHDSGRVELSLMEAIYLVEKKRLEIVDHRSKPVHVDTLFKKARNAEKHFTIRYPVFKDMRNRGYIIKTALKFGADFRVYDRGIRPGDDHAKWIVYAVPEASTYTWYDFAAKNRVAHSTKKRLLIAVVDAEGEVSYWEIRWMRP